MSDKNLLLDLVNYIILYASDIGITADGVDIFRDFQPDSPDNSVCLSEYPGITSYICNADVRSVQVKVRNTSYENGRKRIWGIYNLLYDPENDVKIIDAITVTRWGIIQPRQAPYYLTKDDSERRLFIFNMGVTTDRDE
jgi:hypothetical protein